MSSLRKYMKSYCVVCSLVTEKMLSGRLEVTSHSPRNVSHAHISNSSRDFLVVGGL
jgi:hypothetical protein